MTPKRPRITIDLDESLEQRLETARQATGLDNPDLLRMALTTTLNQIEAQGTLPVAFARRAKSEEPGAESEEADA